MVVTRWGLKVGAASGITSFSLLRDMAARAVKKPMGGFAGPGVVGACGGAPADWVGLVGLLVGGA
jgi:hypothetical protein